MKRKNQQGGLIPKEIQLIITHLEKFGVKEEGIFRVPGETTFVNEKKEAIDKGRFSIPGNEKNHPVLASLLKLYLRELPQPLLMFENYNAYLKLVDENVKDVEKFKSLLSGIPDNYRNLLEILLVLLNNIVSNGTVNKMTTQNLSIVFGMNLLRTKEESPLVMMRDCKKVNEVCSFLIQNAKEIFQK